ncbi:alpha/beta-hydrolase [Hypoxylon sp. NC1633]|nr:alpha/beta-hydrolase [Hypoxylon sp. NC1633]
MSQKSAIVIAQGSFQNASAWEQFVRKLREAGFPTEHVKLPSMSTATPAPRFSDDVAAIQSAISRFRDAGRNVFVLCHSSGGVSGSNSVAGFDNVGVIFVSAFAIAKGKSMVEIGGGPPQPWMDIQGDRIILRPETLSRTAYNDLSEEDQSKWAKELSPTSIALFEGVSQYEPWSEGVPCAYVFCSEDNGLPPQRQQNMAALLGPESVTRTIKSGHSPFLSMPDKLVETIAEIEGELRQKFEA